MNKTISLLVFLTLVSCNIFSSNKSAETDDGLTKKKRSGSVSVKDRVMSDESDGFFSSSKEVDKLGNQNIMWKATLNALNFIPINTADYDGGMIVTDWYSPSSSNESIKINVEFNSNEIKVSSITVKAFKKTCSKELTCKTSSMNENFNRKIKNQILEEVKKLEIKSKTRN